MCKIIICQKMNNHLWSWWICWFAVKYSFRFSDSYFVDFEKSSHDVLYKYIDICSIPNIFTFTVYISVQAVMWWQRSRSLVAMLLPLSWGRDWATATTGDLARPACCIDLAWHGLVVRPGPRLYSRVPLVGFGGGLAEAGSLTAVCWRTVARGQCHGAHILDLMTLGPPPPGRHLGMGPACTCCPHLLHTAQFYAPIDTIYDFHDKNKSLWTLRTMYEPNHLDKMYLQTKRIDEI